MTVDSGRFVTGCAKKSSSQVAVPEPGCPGTVGDMFLTARQLINVNGLMLSAVQLQCWGWLSAVAEQFYSR